MPPASIAPCPAAQFIVSASRRASERIDPIPPTPHGVADDADHPADDRHKEGPVPCDTSQCESHADDHGPLEYLAPRGCLDLEDGEGRLPDHGKPKQDGQLNLDVAGIVEAPGDDDLDLPLLGSRKSPP